MRRSKLTVWKSAPAIGLAAFASLGGACAAALGQSSVWTGADGNSSWSDPNNWSPTGVPGTGDYVYFSDVPPYSGAGPLVYDYTGPAITLGTLNIDATSGNGPASMDFQMSANTLIADAEYVGYYGTASFSQSGGSNTIPDSGGQLSLGYNPGSSGTYYLSGTGSISTLSGNEFVGYYGTGSIVQSGGTNAAGTVLIGNSAASNGTYTLSGADSTCAVTGDEYVGYNGSGTFAQAGGSNSATNLFIGYQSPGIGLYTQSGGTNTVGTLYVGDLSGSSGVYVQTGGTNNVGSLFVGNQNGGTGAYTQTGGTSNVTNFYMSADGTYNVIV